uniref:Uncharacterized protein n=1 Tax=Arundo donax TaxID=35708 RepID=A0A0A9ERT5_ARUDO
MGVDSSVVPFPERRHGENASYKHQN